MSAHLSSGSFRWEEGTTRQAARWGLAAVLVATAHVAGAWGVMQWPKDPGPSDPTGAAVLIELAPLPLSPEAPSETEAGPQMAEAEPEPERPIEPPVEAPETEPLPPPPEPPPPAPEPVPSPPEMEPVPPEPAPPRPVVEAQDIHVPELPDVPNAAAVLTPPAPPPPPPKEIKKEVKKAEKKEPPKIRRVERRREVERRDKRADRTSAPPTHDAPRGQTAAAPSQGVTQAPSQAPATWKSLLSAHLKRHQRYPREALERNQRGTAYVAFTIDRAGRVLSARLARGSGSSMIDQEAVATLQRSSPVPAPPPEIRGATVSLSVPLVFNLR
ncbi:energy transducer TonB [Chelatococcus asaccharovorans]|uniref:Protein TonB n=1 Tax=Chelatococcus asaccharovorans TaxID=28210 RepID=A0A2V3U6K7_9HYPH|nr:energy transducer TonB [Chelatococcus asaccharovorans]MBS7705819.1 energy transducer TonB [Chelatococcus asaccharovorans]PXW58841.1 protein TonB [Chelatococcus asaccharovorans]